MALYLGVDQGSQSSRAVLFNDAGEVVASAGYKVQLKRDDVRAEYDARLLLDSVHTVIRKILDGNEHYRIEDIKACGIATQRSTALLWSRDGHALSPALSWQDTRASDYIDAIAEKQQHIRQLTGLPLTPYYSASKMNWLLHNTRYPETELSQLYLSPLISYLLYHLLSNKDYVIDYSNAQRTQLFELASLNWSQTLCEWFDIDINYLPTCKPMCTDYGCLLDTKVPVTAVCGDQNAAIYGAGELDEHTALVNIGSGAFILRRLSSYSESTDQLTGIAYADGDRVDYLREATINGAGNALSWASQKWHIEQLQQRLPQWLAEIDEPPVFLNTVGGLGTPWMTARIEPQFITEGYGTDAAKAVAVIESIVFLIQANLELMQHESPIHKIVVAGGMANLDGLCQKLSNLSGLIIERPEQVEATARGVAWLAAGRPSLWQDQQTHATFEPVTDAALMQRYTVFMAGLERLLADKPEQGQI